MTKDFKRRLCKNLVFLVMCPISIGVLSNAKKISKAASFRLPSRSSSLTSVSSVNKIQPVTTKLPVNRPLPPHKLTSYEKTLAGITVGFHTAGLVGTVVGVVLTDSQQQQNKDSFDESINSAYNSFYSEREKYMNTLYSQWGMSMPNKYKNPLGTTNTDNKNETVPDRGFSIG